MNENKMQLFENKRIRTAWNEKEQEWQSLLTANAWEELASV